MSVGWSSFEDDERRREIPFGLQLVVVCAMVWALVSGAFDVGLGG